jgi:hypothetical protein
MKHPLFPAKFALLAAFFFAWCSIASAQLSSKYTYSYVGTNPNAYNAAPMTTLQATGTVGNDAVFASQTIGFTFKFNCVDYTTLGISANGFIWFGTGTCAANQYTPLSSTTGETGAVDGIISAFGANLIPGANNTRTLTTKLSGTAPNRIFIIEWRKCCMSGAATNPFDAQIRLFETSNTVEIRLYDWPYGLSGATAIGQVGMRAATTDFVNRTTTGVNLCTTTAGGANTATCSIVPSAMCLYATSASVQAITYVYAFTGSCCTTPTTQASAASAGSVSYTSATLNWTPGNGTGGDIVFLKQGSAIATDPSNNLTYTANPSFGSGSQIGATGAYAVYSGFAGTVAVSNLLPGTTYYYSIYTFDAAGPCYKTPTATTGSFTTPSCTSPTVQASAASLLCIQATTMNLRFTRGNGDRVIVLARAGSAVNADPVFNTTYTANSVFGSGSQIGVGNYVVYDGNAGGTLLVPITGLTPGVTYYFKIYEYNTSPNCYNTVAPATASGITRAPGTYVSSTVTQNSATVAQGTLGADIVKLTIVISGGEDLAATLNGITFTTTGTTNTATDVTNAKIYFTGTNNVFSKETQFGPTFTSFGTNTALDTFALKAGNNYFWIAYDVKSTATAGNVLDATVSSINVTDNLGNAVQIPTVTAPAGSRLITAPVTLVYCSGTIPTACCNGTGCNFSCSQGETLLSISLTGASVVSFGGWPCNGTCGNDQNSYTDRFAANVYSMNQGGSYPMTINFDAWFSLEYDWAIWVDWGQDGVFTNGAPERYPVSGAIDQWTGLTITVPASVSSGRHRARLWVQEFSYPPTTPCRTTHGPLTTSLGYIVDFCIVVPDGSLPDLDPPPGAAVSCPTLAPIVATPIYYTQGDTPVPLIASGTALLWYTSPTGGVGSSTAITPTTTNTGTQTYYVSQNNGSCEGPRTQIVVNVLPLPLPLAPIATPIQPTCTVPTGSIILSGLPTPGTWTINPDGISGSGSGDTIAPLPPGTYSYSITNSMGCISPSSANATINPAPSTPSAPIVTTVTQPSGIGADTLGSVFLTGLPADGWIINPGGIVGAPSVTSVTISGLPPGTYTFTVTNSAGCTSAATVNINIGWTLPIELVSFTAKCDGDLLLLQWITASETNNDHFTIEQSANAEQWYVVEHIKAAGQSNTLQYYEFSYPWQLHALYPYYRLKQTDFDGQFSYSDVAFAENCSQDKPGLSIHPNPSRGIFNLDFAGERSQLRSIEVFNVFGNSVYRSTSYQPLLDLSGLPAGIYMLHFTLDTDLLIEKIVIER